MPLTAERDTEIQLPSREFALAMAGGVTIFRGAIVCLDGSGFAVPGGHPNAVVALAIAAETKTNPGAAGSLTVRVRRGRAKLANSAGPDMLKLSNLGQACYLVDDATVAKTDGGGTRVQAGRMMAADVDGLWVDLSP